ncbi:serine hydrolase domain-containing protein [Fictibacillus fluitans]|uniref:Serine hydrolase domain-containing protein n=1 Tax=Fictibacillus fluitans TaxID=3058422 RepID=A0ABT8HTE0_9BACL|nr:serine hydrolase domain-containing protein [Fictibacillus sp. NE201]MDN4524039.1 serine hydrolase domain-containing protein [Fictibacillus sp. NE201]
MGNALAVSSGFEQYAAEVAKKYQIPGIFIALGKDEKLIYEKGIGFRNTSNELPLSKDTVFSIGSVTKQVTAVAILQLHEQGKLSLHDPVINYLPEFRTPDKERTKEMTIHHLLTHSSGLPPLSTLYGAMKKSLLIAMNPEVDSRKENSLVTFLEKFPEIETYSELLDAISNDTFTLLGPPGAQFSYSNDGYALLGAIVERTSGIKYEHYVKSSILEPAGMQHSVFHYEELKDYEDIAVLYELHKKDEENIVVESNIPWDAPAMRSGGFLKSTARDMLKFSDLFHTGGRIGNAQILTPESVERMTTPYMKCGHDLFYGYGVMIHPDFFGYKLIEHGGAIKGGSSIIGTIPELKLTAVSLANLLGVPADKLLFSAFASYLERDIEDVDIRLGEVSLTVEELKEYEGEFASAEGTRVTFYVDEEGLLYGSEGKPFLLTPVGNDTFLYKSREFKKTLQFIRNENQQIHRIAFGLRQIPKVEEGEA